MPLALSAFEVVHGAIEFDPLGYLLAGTHE
jgi:hypothetical protein